MEWLSNRCNSKYSQHSRQQSSWLGKVVWFVFLFVFLFFGFSSFSSIYASGFNNVSIYAGQSGSSGYVNSSALNSKLKYPYGLAFDSVGNFYFADQDNNVIRKINCSS